MSLSVLSGPTSVIIPIAQRIGLLIGRSAVYAGPSEYSAAAEGGIMKNLSMNEAIVKGLYTRGFVSAGFYFERSTWPVTLRVWVHSYTGRAEVSHWPYSRTARLDVFTTLEQLDTFFAPYLPVEL